MFDFQLSEDVIRESRDADARTLCFLYPVLKLPRNIWSPSSYSITEYAVKK